MAFSYTTSMGVAEALLPCSARTARSGAAVRLIFAVSDVAPEWLFGAAMPLSWPPNCGDFLLSHLIARQTSHLPALQARILPTERCKPES